MEGKTVFTAKEAAAYLEKGGKACIVIGNTAFKKVPVPNAAKRAE